ncbi:MAG: pyrroline-5-carboxylate reductase, partial [Nitrospiraceae bacterium]|nr:pyrroline-5-carboxylate reductase [Nitrospiraceae bacterium]
GGGNMAEAIIKGVKSQESGVRRDILVSEPSEDRRKYLQQTYGIKTTESNKEVASSCNIIILAIKPQNMAAVLDEVADLITEEKTVVSIAAGITLSFLQSKLKTKKLIRVMPNTPAIVQEGMSVMSLCECFSDKDIAIVRDIFMSVGKVLTLPEKYINAVTAVSGSGPAFVALFIEAMIDAGEKIGLSRDNASELAIQTLIGTASLLDTGMPPEKLREMVTSPGGTTAAGLKVFEEKGFKDIVYDALHAAKKRAEELAKV